MRLCKTYLQIEVKNNAQEGVFIALCVHYLHGNSIFSFYLTGLFLFMYLFLISPNLVLMFSYSVRQKGMQFFTHLKSEYFGATAQTLIYFDKTLFCFPPREQKELISSKNQEIHFQSTSISTS